MFDASPELMTRRRRVNPLLLEAPPLPHAGVVWVESVTPADAADAVLADAGIVVELRCLAQLQDALVSVAANGVACTTTSGRLSSDPSSMIRSLTVRTDRRAVTYTVLSRWYQLQGEPATVAITYHGWALAGGVTFTPVPPEGYESAGDAMWEAWATDPWDRGSSWGDIEWEVIEIYHGTERTLNWIVAELSRFVAADVQWICGHKYVDRFVASGLVGELAVVRWAASGLVEGWRLDRVTSSGIVQGWKVLRSAASGVVGIRFVYRMQSSGLVGVETLQRVAASGVVLGVVRDNVLEVHVLSESSYTALAAVGVIWS